MSVAAHIGIPEVMPAMPEALQTLYYFLQVIPQPGGYTVIEANRLIEKQLRRRRIPLSDFVAYTIQQDAIRYQQQPKEETIF